MSFASGFKLVRACLGCQEAFKLKRITCSFNLFVLYASGDTRRMWETSWASFYPDESVTCSKEKPTKDDRSEAGCCARVLPRVTSVEPQVVVPSPKKSVSGAPFPIPNSNNTPIRIVDMVTCLRLCYVALLKGKNKVPI